MRNCLCATGQAVAGSLVDMKNYRGNCCPMKRLFCLQIWNLMTFIFTTLLIKKCYCCSYSWLKVFLTFWHPVPKQISPEKNFPHKRLSLMIFLPLSSNHKIVTLPPFFLAQQYVICVMVKKKVSKICSISITGCPKI